MSISIAAWLASILKLIELHLGEGRTGSRKGSSKPASRANEPSAAAIPLNGTSDYRSFGAGWRVAR